MPTVLCHDRLFFGIDKVTWPYHAKNLVIKNIYIIILYENKSLISLSLTAVPVSLQSQLKEPLSCIVGAGRSSGSSAMHMLCSTAVAITICWYSNMVKIASPDPRNPGSKIFVCGHQNKVPLHFSFSCGIFGTWPLQVCWSSLEKGESSGMTAGHIPCNQATILQSCSFPDVHLTYWN